MLYYSIPNFEKYHPRNDYKSIPWIRFEVNMPMDCKVMELTIAEKWMFVCLLCLFAQSGGGVRETNVKQISKFSGLKIKQIENGLKKLNDFEMIRFHVRDTNGSVRYERTNERTNDTNDSRSAIVSSEAVEAGKKFALRVMNDWNKLCEMYPKRFAKCTTLNPKRQKAILRRRKDFGPESFAHALNCLAKANWMDKNDRKWAIDTLLFEDNFAKAVDGFYESAE